MVEIRNLSFGKPQYGSEGYKGAECEDPDCVRLAWGTTGYGLLYTGL